MKRYESRKCFHLTWCVSLRAPLEKTHAQEAFAAASAGRDAVLLGCAKRVIAKDLPARACTNKMFIIALSWQFFSALCTHFYTGRARVYQKMYRARVHQGLSSAAARGRERESISLHSLLIVDIFSGMMDHSKDDTRYFL
jgi:hypothetical protein